MKPTTRSSAAQIQPQLVALKKAAEELAGRRKEPLSSVHLLAAILSSPSSAAELLLDRRFSADKLLDAGRSERAEAEPLKPYLLKSREIMMRMGEREPMPIHVLIALLGDRRGSAYRAIEQCGGDVTRLRTVAMNVGLGLLRARRALSEAPKPEVALRVPAPKPTPSGVPARSRAVSVSLVPVLASDVRKPPSRKPSSGQVVPLRPTAKAASTRPKADTAIQVADSSAVVAPSDDSTRFELDPHKFPTLVSIGKNLTSAAARGQLDPVVGRQLEVEQTLDVLAKRQGNNPCLIGAAGVGKTSVVRALAQRIADAHEVGSLDDRIVIEIPLGELVAGTGVRGALATRFASIRREVSASGGRIVLFFDEIHQLFSGDAADEIAADLKVALAKGELPCIGATTYDEYRKSIDADPALSRRFSTVEVDEPSREDAFLVLSALSTRLEQHHRVTYDEQALALSIGWSVRYLPGRALPDKAVSIVDLAGARTRRRGARVVTAEMVAEVVAELADMPVERLLETDTDRFLRMEEILGERVVGHAAQLGRIARILRRNAAGLGARRPLGTFLLLGPTGVGKTETAKAVAEALFFDHSAMTRLDMSEYSEPHATAKLIGAPPGYVGHEAGGQLAEAVRRRPYQVVLLDEVEKAHPEVLTTFLAVFDEGRLTDSRGRAVDFTNTVILMTSNLGAEHSAASSKRRVGFSSHDTGNEEVDNRVASAARAALAPELYNRIDEVLVFAALTRDDVREVARRMLNGIATALLAQRGVKLEFTASALETLLDAGGFDPSLGARPMRRTIARLVEAPLAESILRGQFAAGQRVRLSGVRGEIRIDVTEPERVAATL